MSNKFSFTVKSLAAVKPPEAGRIYVYDTKMPGLALCVTANDTRTFYRCGRVNGLFRRVLIGKYPPTTIEQARDIAIGLHKQIVDGNDPQAEKRASRNQMTLDELWDKFKMDYLELHLRGRTKATHLSRWKVCVESWAKGRKLDRIKRSDVSTLHADLARDRGATNANRAIQLLRRVWNYGESNCDVTIANPTKGIKYLRESPRERFLRGQELPRFFASLAAEPEELMRDFFTVCLFTAQRRSNVQAMQWDHVDLDAKLWTIPGTEFKTGRQMTVHLSEPVLAILRRRERFRSGPWVFPGNGKTGHLVEIKGAWKRLCERAGLNDLRPHDLRRTLASWQATGGASLPVIGKSLGHADQASTQVYSHLDIDVVRKSVDATVEAILAAGGMKPTGVGKGGAK